MSEPGRLSERKREKGRERGGGRASYVASTLYIKFMLELLASISGARNATPSGFRTQIVKGK